MCKPIDDALRNAILQPHSHRKVGEMFLIRKAPWLSEECTPARILRKSVHEDGVMMLVEYRPWYNSQCMTARVLWIGNFGQSGWVDISKDKEAKEWCELYRLVSVETSLQAKYG